MDNQTLINQLRQHDAQAISENSNFAAVAILILMRENLNQLFLIKRTEHPNDPWSGQIGLPGGHHEEHDADLIDTAIRETKEETDIDLQASQFITTIDDQQGYATGGKINLTVRPFVFLLENKPDIRINYELDHYFWLPFEHFQNTDHHIYFNPMVSLSQRPGVRLDQSNVLWGMTYRIFTDFFNAANIVSPFVGDYDQSG